MIHAHHPRRRKYKNLILTLIAILLTLFLSRFEAFHTFLTHLGGLGYFGAFIAGMLFVSTFTVTTGALILLVLAETLSPIEIGLVAGLGAVVTDLIIFKFVRSTLEKELGYIYDMVDTKHHFLRLLHTKYFAWTLPVIGAAIIASPIPDEIGVSLLGITKLKTYQFLIISFIMNALGIFLVVSASVFVKP